MGSLELTCICGYFQIIPMKNSYKLDLRERYYSNTNKIYYSIYDDYRVECPNCKKVIQTGIEISGEIIK